MDTKRILVIGNYGAGNLGDDAIFAGIVCELRATGFKGEISLFHGGFESSQEIYEKHKKFPFIPVGIRSRLKGRNTIAYEAIKKADLVILGGGGLFIDTETLMAPMIWYSQAAACIKLKKPYICYSQSIGPLKSFFSKVLAKRTFKNAKAIHFRDKDSANLLKKLLPKAKCTVGTDSAISWALNQKKAKKENLMLLNLRIWKGSSEKEWREIIQNSKRFAKENKLKLALIPMDLRNLAELKKLKNTGIKVLNPVSATEAFSFISKAKLLVTMRLHAGIFALAAATPTLAISYSPKVKNFYKSLNINVNLNKLTMKNQAFLTQVLRTL